MNNNICGLAHFGLYVRNIEVSKAFYTGILGFTITHETAKNGLHLCFLRNGDCEIELVAKPDQPARTDGYFDHLCLRVQDIDAAVAHLRANGIEPEFAVRDMPQVYNGIKMVMFRGPDGEHLEFNQFL
ncbi:MAG: VOC family protein [Clostridia bacterium]|nr:VOC family protein [Clostridia bacterium]